MPMTLTRSLLTVLIPGLVAIVPWLLMLVQHTKATLGFSEYNTLANAIVFASAAVTGMAIEGLGTFIEVKWDKEREEEYQVEANWYSYLARKIDPEPVGYRYLSRLVTTLYSELSLAIAAPSFFLGGGILAALRFTNYGGWFVVVGVAAAVLATWYFFLCAKCTHKVLCKARKEINARLAS